MQSVDLPPPYALHLDEAQTPLEKVILFGRHFLLCCTLFFITPQPKFMPPFMIAGTIFSLADLFLRRKQIHWKAYWPLLLTVLCLVLPLCYIPASIDPVNTQHVLAMRISYLLAPIMFAGLRPSRAWGVSIVVGAVFAFFLCLSVALYHSLYWTGELVFYPYTHALTIPNDWLDPNRFFYTGLLAPLRLWPAYFGFGQVLSIIFLTSWFLEKDTWRKRIPTLLIGSICLTALYLSSNRIGQLALFSVLLVALVGKVFFAKKVAWYLKLGGVIALLAIVAVLSFSRFRIFVDESRAHASEGLEAMIRANARGEIYLTAWEHRDEFLPWGLGAGAQAAFLKKHHLDNCDHIVFMHNEFLDLTVEMGIVGSLLFLVWMGLPFLYYRRFSFGQKMLWLVILIIIQAESVSVGYQFAMIIAYIYNLLWVYAIEYKRTANLVPL